MHLEKLILTHFKNYASQSLTFSEGINCFVGLNGMGKTNLLDAIYYLCMCKSYFLSSDTDVIQLTSERDVSGAIEPVKRADFMRLEGHFQKNKRREKIVAKVQPRKKKMIEKNDVLYAGLSDHIGFLPVVMFAPDDTLLAKEGSEERRRFVDTALSQIDNQYLTNLIFYNKILEQRNALLKKKDENGANALVKPETVTASGAWQEELLDVYDQQMNDPAQYIFEKRRAFIDIFTPVFNTIYKKISGEREAVKIIYNSSLVGDSLTNLIKKSREKDRILQRTTVGIHKDDLMFEIDDKPLKRFGSQGQLKSFVISLKLAQYEILRGAKQETPILLLDDIFDKLDDERVHNFLQLIVNQSFGQIFITDTHAGRINDIIKKLHPDFKIFTIEKGVIVDSYEL